MYEQNTCKNTWKKRREEKTKFSKILPNNQIITACRIEIRVQEMTMNEKLTMTDLIDDEIKTLLVNRKKSSWYDEYWIGWRIREFAVFFPKIYSYIKVGDNAEKGQRKKKISNHNKF